MFKKIFNRIASDRIVLLVIPLKRKLSCIVCICLLALILTSCENVPPLKQAEIGPAGGYVFYDKGYYSDGWRYLEISPKGWHASYGDRSAVYGFYRESSNGNNIIVGTGTAIGTGKDNTEALVQAFGSKAYTSISGNSTTLEYAARICADLEIYRNGYVYDDWFLPSIDELVEIARYFGHRTSLSHYGFNAYATYWSSSEEMYALAWAFDMYKEEKILKSRGSYSFNIRPIRCF